MIVHQRATRCRVGGPRPFTPQVPRRLIGTITPLAAWILLVGGTSIWGRWLQERGYRLFANAPPLTGHWDARFSPNALWAVFFGLLLVGAVPVLAERSSWHRLLIWTFAIAAGWAVVLALGDGARGLILSPASRFDYLHDVHLIGSPHVFLSSFFDRIEGFTTHVRAHPPGMILVLWLLDRAGLGGPWPVAALEIAAGALAVPAALISLREVAGERHARAAAAFVATAPIVIFIASSADAFFAGVGAWAVALLVLSTGRTGRPAIAFALASGALFGALMFLSYGLVLLGLVPLGVALARRRLIPVLVAAVAAAVIVAAFLAAGFWWIDGFRATREQYLRGAARLRPSWYWVVANIGAFAITLGPALTVALYRLRDRRTWLLVGGALLAVAIADISGMSKAEVERIWLPFAPWVLLAGTAFDEGIAQRRHWLAVQVAAAVALQWTMVSQW